MMFTLTAIFLDSENESSMTFSFPGANVPRSESSCERKCVGTKVPVTYITTHWL